VKVGVVIFFGSNCDEDAVLVIVEQLYEEVFFFWYKDYDLKGVDVIIFFGGFSYGDYFCSGVIVCFLLIM
jgi:Phosphoribosylformylglycinamidine (FGAM) synthase, glutamine amidotransferase domain